MPSSIQVRAQLVRHSVKNFGVVQYRRAKQALRVPLNAPKLVDGPGSAAMDDDVLSAIMEPLAAQVGAFAAGPVVRLPDSTEGIGQVAASGVFVWARTVA